MSNEIPSLQEDEASFITDPISTQRAGTPVIELILSPRKSVGNSQEVI